MKSLLFKYICIAFLSNSICFADYLENIKKNDTNYEQNGKILYENNKNYMEIKDRFGLSFKGLGLYYHFSRVKKKSLLVAMPLSISGGTLIAFSFYLLFGPPPAFEIVIGIGGSMLLISIPFFIISILAYGDRNYYMELESLSNLRERDPLNSQISISKYTILKF